MLPADANMAFFYSSAVYNLQLSKNEVVVQGWFSGLIVWPHRILSCVLQQIITVILEQGAKFTELEYIHLLNLLRRSQQSSITDEEFDVHVQKLKRTITEKHVYHV